MQQTVKGGYGTDVGKQAQLLAHGQQALFRPNLRRGVVVVFQVAHGSKENGIGTHAGVMGCLWIGVAHSIDGRSTDQRLLVVEHMPEFPGYGIHHSHTLCHNLRAYTVARQHCDIQFHCLLMFNLKGSFYVIACKVTNST